MKTTVDAAGRLVIPKEVRRQAGIEPGMTLDVRWKDGKSEIEPLTTETVEATLRELSDERGT
jgi:AbrB family looped-hinge helix DNA binding protein